MAKITVVLIEPEHSGNIGSIARLMKNFGFAELALINSKCNHLDLDAMSRATHAKDILKNAVISDFSYLKNFDYVIGTTAILGSDYNIPRSPLSPKQLADKLNKINANAAIVLGREGAGLKNSEIKQCDFIVTIPAAKAYPTLNVSQAAAVILYELFNSASTAKSNDHFTPISAKDKEVILKKIDAVLDKMDFATRQKRETQRKVWKRIIGKAMMTKREAFALLGFLNKLK